MGANGQSAIRKVPTAYGDGLWGLQNTDITDAHGSIITDLLILFLMALWAYGSQTDFPRIKNM